MASTLLKRSLDLFQDDLAEATTSKKKKKSTNPRKLIGTNKKGIKKQLKKIERQRDMERKSKIRKNKSAKDEKNTNPDVLEDNLQMISCLDSIETVQKDTVTKILEHRKGKLSRNRKAEEIQPEVTSSILFDDKDFDADEEKTDWDI